MSLSLKSSSSPFVICINTDDRGPVPKSRPASHACPACPFSTAADADLDLHMAREHPRKAIWRARAKAAEAAAAAAATTTTTTTTVPSRQPLSYTCIFCQQSFRKRKLLTLHIEALHTLNVQKPFLCPICKTGRYSNQHALLIHVTRYHTTDFGQISPALLECLECSTSFPTSQALMGHLEVAHVVHRCPKCHDRPQFATAKLLYDHLAERACVTAEVAAARRELRKKQAGKRERGQEAETSSQPSSSKRQRTRKSRNTFKEVLEKAAAGASQSSQPDENPENPKRRSRRRSVVQDSEEQGTDIQSLLEVTPDILVADEDEGEGGREKSENCVGSESSNESRTCAKRRTCANKEGRSRPNMLSRRKGSGEGVVIRRELGDVEAEPISGLVEHVFNETEPMSDLTENESVVSLTLRHFQSLVQCFFCLHQFRYRDSLASHLKSEHPKYQYMLALPDATDDDVKTWRVARKEVGPGRRFCCPICPAAFSSLDDVTRHLDCEAEQQLVCRDDEACRGRVWQSRADLCQHRHGEGAAAAAAGVSCPYCATVSFPAGALDRDDHVMECHQARLPFQAAFADVARLYAKEPSEERRLAWATAEKCRQCLMMLSCGATLEEHVQKCHGERTEVDMSRVKEEPIESEDESEASDLFEAKENELKSADSASCSTAIKTEPVAFVSVKEEPPEPELESAFGKREAEIAFKEEPEPDEPAMIIAPGDGFIAFSLDRAANNGENQVDTVNEPHAAAFRDDPAQKDGDGAADANELVFELLGDPVPIDEDLTKSNEEQIYFIVDDNQPIFQ